MKTPVFKKNLLLTGVFLYLEKNPAVNHAGKISGNFAIFMSDRNFFDKLD